MSELKLEPGWLDRDVALATKRADDWSADKQNSDAKRSENRSLNEGENTAKHSLRG